MTIEIQPYTEHLLGAMTEAMNKTLVDVPFSYPVDKTTVQSALRTPGETLHPDLNAKELALLVATQGKEVVGFADLAVGCTSVDKDSEHGLIRFFWVRRGLRDIGQRLLVAAENMLLEAGMKEVEAFPQEFSYPFYHMKYAYLTDRLDHVVALLAFNGYAKTRGEVFLVWYNYEPQPPVSDGSAGVTFTEEWKEGKGALPNFSVYAHRDDMEVGVCDNVSFGECTLDSGAQEWTFTTHLNVVEAWQGKRLGKRLLQHTLNQLHKAGYRNAAISTAWDNHRAFLFYSNFGYRVLDWTYGYTRVRPLSA